VTFRSSLKQQRQQPNLTQPNQTKIKMVKMIQSKAFLHPLTLLGCTAGAGVCLLASGGGGDAGPISNQIVHVAALKISFKRQPYRPPPYPVHVPNTTQSWHARTRGDSQFMVTNPLEIAQIQKLKRGTFDHGGSCYYVAPRANAKPTASVADREAKLNNKKPVSGTAFVWPSPTSSNRAVQPCSFRRQTHMPLHEVYGGSYM
jgi:hypothetical protein